MLYENYQSPWLDDELRILRDAAGKFFEHEFKPLNERWITQGKVDRDACNKAGEAGLLCAAVPTAYGGGGYMDEYDISRMYADARVQKIYGGTNEIMKELIGRTLG
jgi:acyl-CoA dehydrogenase